jgi:hypothetical protein
VNSSGLQTTGGRRVNGRTPWKSRQSAFEERGRDPHVALRVLSASSGYEIRRLAAGVSFDATIIRALLVPALMRLLDDANWRMPNWSRVALRLPLRLPAPVIQGG